MPPLSGKAGSYKPIPRASAEDEDKPSIPQYTDSADALPNPHDLVDSDSEDEDWRNEKALLSNIRRNGSTGLAMAYDIHDRARVMLPAWISRRQLFQAIALLFLAAIVVIWMTRPPPSYQSGPLDGQSEPWYPAPKGGTLKAWDAAYVSAAALVSRMTLLEKVNVTTGTGWEMGMCVGNTGPAPGVGFPSLCLQDGPLGLRFADNITAGPAAITVGATWNRELMQKRGRMLGLEARAKGINAILGPSVGPLGRIPRGGRNWEAFGIDPVLQGQSAAMTIRGIQQEGVMATIKHFVANEQEHYRQAWEWGIASALSSNLDDRTLHEMYAWPFADSIREGVASVMCSYNQVNNSYACQNSKLMNGILKDEMGFQGFVQSDWLAQRSGVAAALAGLDMSMPGDGEHWQDGQPFWGPYLTMAVMNGTVPVDRLDDAATRIVAAWYLLGQDKWEQPPPNGTGRGPNFSSWTNERTGLLHPGSDDKTTAVVNDWVDAMGAGNFSHADLVRRIAAEGIVLLKNDGDFLPLSTNGRSEKAEKEQPAKFKEQIRVAVYGEDAVEPDRGPNTCPDRACNKGTLASGWGSGAVEFPYLVSPWEALSREFRSLDVVLRLWPDNRVPVGAKDTPPEDQDLCVVFANADAGEGFAADGDLKGDRNDLRLQKGGEELIRAVARRCGRHSPNRGWFGAGHGKTVVVVHAVGPVLMESFAADPGVGAILLAGLPGQESGNALADVLFGRLSPSGRLPYTIAKQEKDYGPAARVIYRSSDAVPQQNFTEGLLVDYRHLDAHGLTPRYEFGFGLSYTTFAVDDARLSVRAGDGQSPDEHLPPRPPPQRPPPSYASRLPDPSSLLFPSGWRRLAKYIYPYLPSASVPTDPAPPSFPSATQSAAGGGSGGHPALFAPVLDIEVDVSNTGVRAGATVLQVYVCFPADVREEQTQERIAFPPRVLRAFHKVVLAGAEVGREPERESFPAAALNSDTVPAGEYPFARSGEAGEGMPSDRALKRPEPAAGQGETRTASFVLTRRDLSYWSVVRQSWVLPRGKFVVEVGFSSRDIRKRVEVFG